MDEQVIHGIMEVRDAHVIIWCTGKPSGLPMSYQLNYVNCLECIKAFEEWKKTT